MGSPSPQVASTLGGEQQPRDGAEVACQERDDRPPSSHLLLGWMHFGV